MTEEIIIDGVNVAGCNFYKNEICNSPINTLYKVCKNIKPEQCYYKQLIRLKQQHNGDTEEIAKLGLDIAILEQENKELKEYSQRMENQRENYYKEYNKCRSVLEEIRNLCNKGAGVYTNAKVVGLVNEVLSNEI